MKFKQVSSGESRRDKWSQDSMYSTTLRSLISDRSGILQCSVKTFYRKAKNKQTHYTPASFTTFPQWFSVTSRYFLVLYKLPLLPLMSETEQFRQPIQQLKLPLKIKVTFVFIIDMLFQRIPKYIFNQFLTRCLFHSGMVILFLVNRS